MTSTLERQQHQPTGRPRTDVIRTAGVVSFAALATVVPRSREIALVERLGRIRVGRRAGKVASLGHRIETHLGAPDLDGSAAAALHLQDHLEELWGMGRGLTPGGWHPEYRVRGLEHLHQAARSGRGIVIWRMGLGPSVPLNLALGEAGHPPVHLTHEHHRTGSRSWFSHRIAGPVLRRGEYRSVADRVVTSDSGNVAAIARLRRRLLEGATVTIRGDAPNGMRLLSRPFLDGTRVIAVGAPAVAHNTGATLLTAAVIREGPLRYGVFIDAPITTDRSLARREFQERAVSEFAERMAERVRQHPWTLPRARRPVPVRTPGHR